MSGRNKGRKKGNHPNGVPNETSNQDYDISKSFKKVSSYSKSSRQGDASETVSEDLNTRYNDRGAISSSQRHDSDNTFGTQDLSAYFRLEDRLSSISDKNEEAHTFLRQELEGKIEKAVKDSKDDIKNLQGQLVKKLSKQWFIWTVSGLGAFISMIWFLSYSEVAKTPTEIIKLNHRIEKLENLPMTHPIDSIGEGKNSK